MDVYEVIESRRAVRAFTDEAVPVEVLERVLATASRSPSGGNLQPWNVYVLTGAALTDLKQRAMARVAAGDSGDEREFEMYPAHLKSPYAERRAAAGAQRYRALDVAIDDDAGRRQAVEGNWDCFGAPAALFVFIDRDMGAAQWADLGMFLQTVMLLLRAEELHSCPQLAWSVYHRSVAEVVGAPPELMLFCGLSVGFEDVHVPSVRIDRAPLAETVTFLN
jgi:nitroreductase